MAGETVKDNSPLQPLPVFVCPSCGAQGDWPTSEPEWTIAECNVMAADGHLPMMTRTLAFRLARALCDLIQLKGKGRQ